MILIFFLLFLFPSCSSGQGKAWSRYVDACAARVEQNQQPFCNRFPLPPGGKDRAELVGAIIGAAQDVGEIGVQLAVPALAGKVAVE